MYKSKINKKKKKIIKFQNNGNKIFQKLKIKCKFFRIKNKNKFVKN